MALEGNNGSGNFGGFDVQNGCGKMTSGVSALGYPPAPCWQSGIGIGNYGLNHSQTIPSTTNPPNGVPLGGVGSSFCLDDIFTFPVHVMDTVDMVSDSQQMVKLESQLIVPNFMVANNKENNKDQGASNGEEPTSSQSTGESQSSRKRKNQANDNSLLKSLPSLADKNGEGETKVKQPRSTEAAVNKEAAKPNSKQTQEKSKPSEAPKDFIHVRARRGQATDSHSLAERVRREKISERMKLLQDLVPGCNKITGKAVMLDEIINYVQSLQRQVEFLSMKLEAVNPRMELSTESFLPKHMVEQSEMASYAPDSTIAYPQFSQSQWSSMQVGVSYEMEHQQFLPNAEVPNKKIMNDKFSLMDSFGDAKNPNVWEEELQTLVRTGPIPNVSFASHNFHGPFATSPTNI